MKSSVNLLKALYIGLFLIGSFAISFYAFFVLISQGFTVAWLGVILASFLPVATLSYLLVFKTRARTQGRLPLLSLLGVIGVLLALLPFFGNGESAEILPLLLSITGFVLFQGYNFWYSSLGRRPNPALELGQPLPQFNLMDVDGKSVSSASYIGSPALFLFYRGNWCPLCMAQINEIADQYKRLHSAGVRVALISPQPEKQTQSLAKSFGVEFDFLIDKGSAAARQLRIDAPFGLPFGLQALGYESDTVLPTVIATNKNGIIIFSDQTDNYRVRPEPETFLSIFEETNRSGC